MKRIIIILALVLSFGFTTKIEVSGNYQLIIFEGSDWCPNCIRLEKKILNDTSFIQHLNSLGIKLVRIDFPQRKKLPEEKIKYNEKIAEKYKFEGIFPTVILASRNGASYEKMYYENQSVEEFKADIKQRIERLGQR